MMQQMTRDGHGEATERVMWYESTQPLIANLSGSGEAQAKKKQHRQLDFLPARGVATRQVFDRSGTSGKHQHKEGRKGSRKIRKADLWQFLRFCIVGTSNAVIDFLVLNVLLWVLPTVDTWRVLSYNSLAVLLAATNSFFWNKYWTFQQRHPITFQELYRFIVVASGTMLMNDTLMWLLGGIFPGIMRSSLLGANALKLGAIIGTMSISFFGMRLWVFFQKRYAGEARSQADDEAKRLLTIKLVSDVETVITAALKPAFAGDPINAGAPSRSRSSLLAVVQAPGISSKTHMMRNDHLPPHQTSPGAIRPVKLLPLK